MSNRDLKAGYFKLGEACPICKLRLHVYPDGERYCVQCGHITVPAIKSNGDKST